MAGAVSVLPVQGQQSAGSIDVPPGAQVLLQAKGEGVQIYSCRGSDGVFKWALEGPDARLLDSAGRVIGRHFAGPTWQLQDGSRVQGELMASEPSPDAGSVAWLLLRAKAGTGTGKLAAAGYVRRTETHGGAPDQAACRSSSDAGKQVRVPYSATYTFYSAQ